MMNFNKQKGVAALFYVLLVPPLFGLYSLATDGAIMIQKKARMNDALESASLAVSALNDENIDAGAGNGSQVNIDLARSYIEQYMDSADDVDWVKVERHECEQIPACVTGLANGGQRYYQYEVHATSLHTSLYPNVTSNIEPTYHVGATGKAEKYQGLPVDIIFVVDYSGSMGDPWTGDTQDKYISVRNVIQDVTDEIEKINSVSNAQDSNVGLTGYSEAVRISNSPKCFRDMLYMDYKTYSDGTYRRNDDDVIERSVNYSNTVKKKYLLNGDKDQNRIHIPYEERDCLNTSWLSGGFSNNSTYYDIPLTTNFTSFNTTVKTFDPSGYTASYQGVIRGAQLLHDGKNPKKLMIVLSDGADYGNNRWISSGEKSNVNIAETLYGSTYNMCQKIRDGLDNKSVSVDMGTTNNITMQVESKIVVIGFDYDLDANKGLKWCAGEENVYKAENKDEILSKILELISEEIGHLKS